MPTRLDALQGQLDELLAVRSAEHGEFLSLADQDDELNDAQQSRWVALTDRFDRAGRWAQDDEAEVIRDQIDRLTAIRNAPPVTGERVERADTGAGRQVDRAPSPTFYRQNTDDPFASGTELGTADQVRDAAFRAVEKIERVPDFVRSEADRLLRAVDTLDRKLARHIIATGRPAYRSAFSKLMGGVPELMTESEREAATYARSMSLSDASGGYAVPFVLDPTVINTAANTGAGNPWRQVSDVVQVVGDNWNGVSSAGVTAYMAGEAEEAIDGAPTFGQPTISVKKAQALVPFSIEIGMDFAGLEGEIRTMFAFAKDNLEDTEFATGTGSGNHVHGAVTDTVAAGATYIQNSATTDTFATADVYALENKLSQRFRSNASFVANHYWYNKIRQFDTAGGAQMWERIGAGQPLQLLGYNTYESGAMDSALDTSAENYAMLFGDFKQAYKIVDRLGATVELIPHLLGTTNNLPNGQRGLYFYWRFGAAVVNQRALVVLDVT